MISCVTCKEVGWSIRIWSFLLIPLSWPWDRANFVCRTVVSRVCAHSSKTMCAQSTVTQHGFGPKRKCDVIRFRMETKVIRGIDVSRHSPRAIWFIVQKQFPPSLQEAGQLRRPVSRPAPEPKANYLCRKSRMHRTRRYPPRIRLHYQPTGWAGGAGWRKQVRIGSQKENSREPSSSNSGACRVHKGRPDSRRDASAKLAVATPVSNNETFRTAPDVRGRTSSSISSLVDGEPLGRGTPLNKDAALPSMWTELGSMLVENSISHGAQAEWTGVTSIPPASTGYSSTRCSCGCDSDEESQTSEVETTTHSKGVVSPLNGITNKWTNVVPGEPTAEAKNGVTRAAPLDSTENCCCNVL